MPNPQPQDQPTTVLVVDDEDGIRHALDRFLTRLGYRVLQASSGAEALDRQAAEQPQVMLSDIRMPNMSGVELVRRRTAGDSQAARWELSLLRGLRLLLARLAARNPAERADETDEGPAVRAGVPLRGALFIAAVAAHHRIVLHQLRLLGHGR